MSHAKPVNKEPVMPEIMSLAAVATSSTLAELEAEREEIVSSLPQTD